MCQISNTVYIHRVAHCQEFENSDLFISKAVRDIPNIPTDLKLCSLINSKMFS